MRIAILSAVTLAGLVALTGTAHGHGMRTAYIEITEADAGHARVRIRSKLPVAGVELRAAAPCSITADADTGTWLACPGTLAGAELTVEGLGPIASEAILQIALRDGSATNAAVTPRDPSWTIPAAVADETMLDVAGRYVVLGVEHIGTGADHLCFLLALVLCLTSVRAVLLAETAFTLSHTLSFSASALGWIRVSAPAAEACIAASLVLIALDIGKPVTPATDRAWKTAALAFAFGLVHGLGFAGGLAEIGVPASSVPAALAGFAAGVELGQIAFLAIALAVFAAIRRAPRLARGAVTTGAYAIGGVGCLWLLERIGSLR